MIRVWRTVARALGGPVAAVCLVPLPAHTQDATWNDRRTSELVERAVARRSNQFADSALSDYRARARGYLTFLAQFGEGFTEPPRAVKVDELAVEVLWRAPDLTKQRLIGRRDTLLLPADVGYYRSRFGIIQNNFPDLIRMGDGQDVRDVPHPLSPGGLELYDFAITDSLSLQLPERSIDVYAVQIRPRDEREPRVIGTAYIDRHSAAVARLTFTFTRRALLDRRIEMLSVVLENALVQARFWLPSRQEVEVVRRARWLDFPARGIIRARWRVCCYELNVGLERGVFVGPEIVRGPLDEASTHEWSGSIIESLPEDVVLLTDDDTRRVLKKAREIASAGAINQLRGGALSARRLSDFIRLNRVEGLALGVGGVLRLGGGAQVTASGRVGFADKAFKARLAVERRPVQGVGVSLYASRSHREIGDVMETSLTRNSIAAGLFGRDDTDPYETLALGFSADFEIAPELHLRTSVAYERQDRLGVNATPLGGLFRPTVPAWSLSEGRVSLTLIQPATAGPLHTHLDWRAELRAGLFSGRDTAFASAQPRFGRISVQAHLARTFGSHQLVLETVAAGVTGTPEVPPQEFVFLGGPRTAPGYGVHELAGKIGIAQRVEWQLPAPFVSIPLGRYGRTPPVATLVPFANFAYVRHPPPFGAPRSGLYPSVGVGMQLFFDLLRIQLARGLRAGQWTFSVDVTRDLWSIL